MDTPGHVRCGEIWSSPRARAVLVVLWLCWTVLTPWAVWRFGPEVVTAFHEPAHCQESPCPMSTALTRSAAPLGIWVSGWVASVLMPPLIDRTSAWRAVWALLSGPLLYTASVVAAAVYTVHAVDATHV